MNLSRRGFFKATGAALATTMAFELSSQTQAFASESKQDWKLVNTEEYTSICCYCAGGCWDTSENGAYVWVNKPGTPEFTTPTLINPKKDMTLQDPMCVYQQFKKHYSRYTLDTVCGICGMDKDVLELVYKTYTSTAKPGKAGTVLYALGQTQHTYGAQNTRAMSVMQLLLGNIGIPGGGVNALRGEPNVQGATDMGMMVNEHPAYLKWANTTDRASLRKWLESQTYSDGYYTNKPKFIVSSLKEWFGENATVDNDYGYDWWPKVPSETGAVDYTHISTF